MSRSSAEPMIMPRARSNSAIRQGAVGGESAPPVRPLRAGDERVPEPLMIPFEMVVRDILVHRVAGNVARPSE